MLIHVLAVGDVVGEGGQDILSRRLPELRKETGAHFTVVNGENASGVGITPFLDKEDRILRPANYAGRVPGRGFGIYQCQGLRLAVLNIMGRVDLNSNLDSPFKAANFHWSRGGFDLMLVDFHAEATSEKGAMGWHLDGRAAAVWGTHTHVPTADCRVLPGGTGFVTDLGMTGPINSVLGIKPENSLNLFLGGLPRRYEEAEGRCKLNACLFTIDTEKKRCLSVRRTDLEE